MDRLRSMTFDPHFRLAEPAYRLTHRTTSIQQKPRYTCLCLHGIRLLVRRIVQGWLARREGWRRRPGGGRQAREGDLRGDNPWRQIGGWGGIGDRWNRATARQARFPPTSSITAGDKAGQRPRRPGSAREELLTAVCYQS